MTAVVQIEADETCTQLSELSQVGSTGAYVYTQSTCELGFARNVVVRSGVSETFYNHISVHLSISSTSHPTRAISVECSAGEITGLHRYKRN